MMRLPKVAPTLTEVLPSGSGSWPESPESMQRLVRILRVSDPLVGGKYLHWDDVRYREAPDGLTVEEWWCGIRHAREQLSTQVKAMSDTYQRSFTYAPTDEVRARLHRFDRGNVSEVLVKNLDADPDVAMEYRVRQLIEEAISSSEIEGARPTTREVARELVREGREPISKDERMVLNNWRAMRRIVELRDEKEGLDLNLFLELHRILGEDALDVDGAAGTFRGPAHDIRVEDGEGNVWHTPPPANDSALPPIKERVERLLQFANERSDAKDGFVHPILRAIICHFWLGYEHPFRDGNGRMARALFYWVMLRNGYEMAEFLSISGPIDRAVRQYYRAFALVETDRGDLTYFVLHQLDVISRALDELHQHLEQRAKRMARLARQVRNFDTLNHRQRALLQKAVRHPVQSYTIKGHAQSHQVHYQTARADLSALVEAGFLKEGKGNPKRYAPTKKLSRLLQHET